MLAFCAAAFQAEAAFYLRPTGQIVSFTDDSIDTDVGYGGGVALGGAFGKEQQFEVGAELSASTNAATVAKYEYVGSELPRRMAAIPVEGDIEMYTALATFRFYLKKQDASFRPFFDVALGLSGIDMPEAGSEGGGNCLTGGGGGGVSCRLGRLTRLDVRYRYLVSGKVETISFYGSSWTTDFRPSAHILSIAIDQRF